MSYEQIIGPIIQLIDTIFIYINSLIYDFVSFVYQIFVALAGARIFTSEQYQAIANRVYVIIGVVSLFLISYVLLKAIVDPDGTSKSEYSTRKIIPNVIKVVMFIGLTPVIFSMAYKIQDIVVNTGVIQKIIFDKDYGSGGNGDYDYDKTGRQFANSIYTSFMYHKPYLEDEEIEINACYFPAPNCKGIPRGDGFFDWTGEQLEKMKAWMFGDDYEDDGATDPYTFAMAKKEVDENTKNFQVYANFGSKMHGERKEIEYNPIFQLIAGIVVIYVLINYCIDLGVRAVKLGYYQIIAPIPILTIMIPGQNKIFQNWLKSSISTFLDVFFRIAVFFLGMLAIRLLPSTDTAWAGSLFTDDPAVQNFARVFIIIGILIFIKQAPKLLSDVFGIQGGGFKLGIKDKLGEMAGIGNSVKKGLERAEGAAVGGATGALGGAYSALMNKGSIRKGAKTGFWTGFKGSGNQFGKQMQNIYSQGGGKGVVGAFGGQKWSDRMSDRYKDQYKDDYQDRILSARVNKKTDFTDPKQRIYQFYQDQKRDLSNQKQHEIDNFSEETSGAKAKMDNAKANFDKNKQAKLDAVKAQAEKLGITGVDGEADQISVTSAKNLIQGYENYEKNKQAKLAGLKTDIDTMQNEQTAIMGNAKEKYNQSVAREISTIQTDMSQAQIKFDSDKKQKLDTLNKELNEQYSLGNSSAVQRIQDEIRMEQGRRFDSTPYTQKIAEWKSKKFEDSDMYRTGKAEFDTRLQMKMQEYDDVTKKTYETDEASDYKIHYTKATKDAQKLFTQYQEAYSHNVEDDEEYKTAKSLYEDRKKAYDKSNADLNEYTETIIRHVYDEKTKRLVAKAFNPYYEQNGLDKYVDLIMEDGELKAPKEARVTKVDATAFDNAVGDLKDKDETFKNEDTVLGKRIADKEDFKWLKSPEGRHMNMMFKNYFDKKTDKADGDKK